MSNPISPSVILVAEDEPADAYLAKVAFAENRILADLHFVTDGREVLEFLRRQTPLFADAPRPDIILLDLNMPRMNGHECLAELKKDSDFCDIPVIILTTSNVQRDVMASYELGAAGFITKPIDVRDFIDVIGKLGDYWLSLVKLPHRRE